MLYLNRFLVGADPEFAAFYKGKLVNVYEECHFEHLGPVGYDHRGDVIEIRPQPARSIYTLLKRMKDLFKDEALKFPPLPESKWLAGPYLQCTRQASPRRHLCLGGHVHFGLITNRATSKCLDILDNWCELLTVLEIYPMAASELRKRHGYGKKEHRLRDNSPTHWEYRSFPSWLFHPKVAALTLIGAKLIVTEPDRASEILKAGPAFAIIKKLFEAFTADSDVARFKERVLDSNKVQALQFTTNEDFRERWGIFHEP